MDEYLQKMDQGSSIGIIYGDVSGLKKINDSLGHHAGDALLIKASGCLKRTFPKDPLFRIGGDEFLVLCSGISMEKLQEKVALLRKDLDAHEVSMAIGSVWQPDGRGNMDKLLAEADRLMYEDKRRFYEEKC
jgi:diguanylate cyclase (GGDEF)-like protein